MATAVRLFEQASHATAYSKFRPIYPKVLLEIISSYISRNGGEKDMAVDVGCGSGQSTFYLLDCFKQCIGVDISKAQIDEAQKKCEEIGTKNVHFLEGSATELPVESYSADVVTIAQAWHWIPDVDKFYSECKRVLKPGGCLAVYGYGNVRVKNDSCNYLVRDFYLNTLQDCWQKERHHIDNEYAEVVLPFSSTEQHDTEMSKTFSLGDFIGYVSSWSAYQQYCKLNPGNKVLEDLQQQLAEALQTCSSGVSSEETTEIKMETTFPLFLILGQK